MKKRDKYLVIENTAIYQFYYERLINLALAQFEWHGLPETCDRRYFERQLLFRGSAAMLKPKNTDFWLSLGYLPVSKPNQVVPVSIIDSYLSNSVRPEEPWQKFFDNGMFNVYGYPTNIRGIGFNAEQCETDEWMMLYDNMTCSTLVPKIDMYAKLLWEAHMTLRSNLQIQNTPYIVKTSRNRSLTFENLFNRILGYEPVIQVAKSTDLDDIQTLDLRVDFKGNEMLQLLKGLWAEALAMLGITAETTKKERMLANEITINRQEDIISLNSRLLNRIEFCNKMNKKYGMDLSVNISSQDYELPIHEEVTEAYGDLYRDNSRLSSE